MARKKKQQRPWQYQFSFALVGVTVLLVVGFFLQSSQAVRESAPISIALDRITAENPKSAEQ